MTWHAYLGIDQHGAHYTIQKYPRKELMAQLGSRHASRMYRERHGEPDRHVGYVVRGLWITVYKVTEAFS